MVAISSAQILFFVGPTFLEFSLLRSSYFFQVSYLFEASNFSEMLLFQQSYFLKIKHFFRAATFSEDPIFGSSYFFRKAIISSIFFLRKFRFQSFFNFWCHFKKEKWNIGITQQTINVDSTLINVEITSRLRSTWYPRWFKVDFSTLIHR